MKSTSAQLQQQLRPYFPQETVEFYPLGGGRPGHRVVIVSKQFEGLTKTQRDTLVRGHLPAFGGPTALWTPAEVKDHVLQDGTLTAVARRTSC